MDKTLATLSDILNINTIINSQIKILLNSEIIVRKIIKGPLQNLNKICPSSNKNYHTYKIYPGAYIIQCRGNGVYYIGSTSDLYSRLSHHRQYIRKDDINSIKELRNSYEEYGMSLMTVTIIFADNREEAFNIEQSLLDVFYNDKNCVNKSSNAKYKENVIITQETKDKISLSNKEMAKTPRFQKWLKEGRYGQKGSKQTIEVINKRALANTGKKRTPEAILNKIAGAKDQCKAISIDGVIYTSISEAVRKLGIGRRCIRHRLKSQNTPNYKYL